MPSPSTTTLASVVIPTWNGAHILNDCLLSVRRQTYPKLEVIVVDGASADHTQQLIQTRFPEVRLLVLTENRGFAGNVNAGIRAARGENILLLNNDAEADPEWVSASVAALAADPGTGSVAALMLHTDGQTINTAGDSLTLAGQPVQRGSGQPLAAPWDEPAWVFGASGGAVAYRREMLRDVGLLDEQFFMYLEDVDLAFRAQLRGWKCRYEPAARVNHRISATGGGKLASYYNGRNLIRVLAKNLPASLLGTVLPKALRFQARRAQEALAAWRGAEARATLRGQAAGLASLPLHLAARGPIQRRRFVSDDYVRGLLANP